MLERLRFQYKLFILFSVFALAILLISGFIFYFYAVSVIDKNISDTQKQTTQKLREQIDSVLDEMDRTSIAINSSQYIMNILKSTPENAEENYFDLNPRENSDMESALFSYLPDETIRGRISLISKNYDYVSLNNKVDNKQASKEYIRSIQTITDIMASNQYKVYLPPHVDFWSTDNSAVFSVIRPLRDIYGVYGLVEVDRDIGELDNILSSKDISRDVNVCIFDKSKKIIYNNFGNSSAIDKGRLYNNAIANSEFGSYTVNTDGVKFIASYTKLSSVDWTVAQFENMTAYREPISVLSRIILAAYIAIFAFLLITLYILTGSLTKPIRNLKESVLNIDTQNLRLEFEKGSTNNEIALLSDAFQNLLNEVKQNAELMLQSREREMKAHMLALQTQMNPHFLYNTLAVIGAYGQRKGNAEVAGMCADLSRMLRYTIDFGNEATNIGAEIEQVKNYLKLMGLRFEGYLEYEIDVEPAILEIKVPKLILEPIVENAFRHGFADVEPPWDLKLSGGAEDSRWRVRVSNNGRGFSYESIAEIQSKLDEVRKGAYSAPYSNDIAKGGLGLINAFMRLHIFYKGTEYIHFGNLPEKGVEVIIGGPVRDNGEGKNI